MKIGYTVYVPDGIEVETQKEMELDHLTGLLGLIESLRQRFGTWATIVVTLWSEEKDESK